MAMLTNSRNTPEMADGAREIAVGVEAATTVYLGSMVAADANGNAVPAQPYGAGPLAKLSVLGRAERVHAGIPGQDAVNVAPVTSGAAGALKLIARRGVFMYGQDGSITEASVGAPCFAVDDNTVSASDGSANTVVAPAAATVPASVQGAVIPLGHHPALAGSVVVQNAATNATVTYVEGKDYVVDYAGGAVILCDGTTIAASVTVYIGYSYQSTAPARPVAGRVAQLDPSGEVWVDFWHQAAQAV